MNFNYLKTIALLLAMAMSIQYSKAQTDVNTLSRAELLKRYAPIFHMGVNTGSGYFEGQDLIVGVDQDYNWGTYDDNEDIWADDSHWSRTTLASDVDGLHVEKHDIPPIVYGSVIELEDVYILGYEVYHTYNEIAGLIGDHLNDIEGVNVVVHKSNGYVKGITTRAHSDLCWATQWAGTDRPSIFHNYNTQTYKLWMTGTHPNVWVGSNGPADLFYMTHGHAIFPFHQKMNSRGVTYMVAEDDIAVKPTSIGSEINDREYTVKAKYLVVPEEELLVKDKMGKAIDKMYRVGENMGTWGGKFWGNGWYGYVSEGSGDSNGDVRYRYNDSYGGDMSFNYLYHPVKGIGIDHPNLVEESAGGLALSSSTRAFHKQKYANIPGSGFFDNNGAKSQDLLNYSRTTTTAGAFEMEAMIRRVGKLHIENNWFSNPFKKSYVNGTGPTAGIMIRSGLNRNDNFIYLAWAPERDNVVLLTRNADVNNGQVKVEYLNLVSTQRYLKVSKQENEIILLVKDMRYPEEDWEEVKRLSVEDAGLEGLAYGALLTHSDINSTEGYYWTNGEYDAIRLSGFNFENATETTNSALKSATVNVSATNDALANENISTPIFNIFPNPVQAGNLVKLQITVQEAGEGKWRIFDLNGQELLVKTIQLSAGANTIELALEGITKGVYVLQVESGEFVEAKKLLVK